MIIDTGLVDRLKYIISNSIIFTIYFKIWCLTWRVPSNIGICYLAKQKSGNNDLFQIILDLRLSS